MNFHDTLFIEFYDLQINLESNCFQKAIITKNMSDSNKKLNLKFKNCYKFNFIQY